jgi:hypothetical protein
MVAEHIEFPAPAMRRIASLLKPSGLAVIYTPYKWAPMSLAASITPFGLHNPLKRLLWNSEARDTFPTQYKLNTRADIDRHARSAGLRIAYFERLDDCRISNSYRRVNRFELLARNGLRRIGVPYPEACLIAALSAN